MVGYSDNSQNVVIEVRLFGIKIPLPSSRRQSVLGSRRYVSTVGTLLTLVLRHGGFVEVATAAVRRYGGFVGSSKI